MTAQLIERVRISGLLLSCSITLACSTKGQEQGEGAFFDINLHPVGTTC